MEKLKAMFRNSAKPVAAGFAVMGLGAQQAFAEVPADVTSALSAAQADGVEIAGIVLGVIIAIAAFKYIRRAL